MKYIFALCLIALTPLAIAATMPKGSTVCTSAYALDRAKTSEFVMGKYIPVKGCIKLVVDMDVEPVKIANTAKVARMQKGHYDIFYIAIDDLRK